MTELPQSWASCELGDVATITTGTTPPTKEPSYYGGTTPFVKPSDLDGEVPLSCTAQTLSEAGAGQARLLRVGAVLVSCIGNLGKVSIAGAPDRKSVV